MLKTRLLTALIGIPLVVFFVYLGGWALAGLGLLVAALTVYEYCMMLKNKGYNVSTPVVVALAAVVYGLFVYYKPGIWVFFAAVVVIAFGIWHKKTWSLVVAGISYIALGVASLMLLRVGTGLMYPLLFALMATWMTDSGAYFVGRKWGKKKLAPVISPNKTVEGSVGGVASAILGGIIFSFFVTEMTIWQILPVAVVLSVISEAGDLAESALKRWAGVKDSGNILPGHGGFFDRLDSLIPVGWVAYLLFCL